MTGDVDALPRYLTLLWGRDEPARRGPKPGIAIGDIGAAAVAVADADGLDGVSMKAVAAALGVTTMSLYRYVDSKDELLAVMLDRAYGPPEVTWTTATGWRTRAERWARALASALLAHPWSVALPMHEPPMTPNVLAWTDRGVQAFETTALGGQATMSSLLLLDGFVRHHVRQSLQLGAIRADGSARADDGGYESSLLALTDDVNFGALRAAATEMASVSGAGFYDHELDFGLGVLLDGLAARVDSAAPL